MMEMYGTTDILDPATHTPAYKFFNYEHDILVSALHITPPELQPLYISSPIYGAKNERPSNELTMTRKSIAQMVAIHSEAGSVATNNMDTAVKIMDIVDEFLLSILRGVDRIVDREAVDLEQIRAIDDFQTEWKLLVYQQWGYKLVESRWSAPSTRTRRSISTGFGSSIRPTATAQAHNLTTDEKILALSRHRPVHVQIANNMNYRNP